MLYTKKHKTRLLINLSERHCFVPVHRLICLDDTVKKEKKKKKITILKYTMKTNRRGEK